MSTKLNIYIDGNNLYRAAKALGFIIDYKKFFGWLKQKYGPTVVYLFIGFIKEKIDFYLYLRECGFIIIFKPTIPAAGIVKGNCDAELVLKATSDFYEKNFDKAILITGDGDFGCLVVFLAENSALYMVIAPNKYKCSSLLKDKNIEITFLNDHYHKFSSPLNEKAPDADSSA